MYTFSAMKRIEPQDMSVRLIWQVVPCAFAVVGAPIISTAYSLTRSQEAELGSFSLAQGIRGTICLVLFLVLYLSRNLILLEHRIIRPLMFLSIYAVLTCFLSRYPFENITFSIKLAYTSLLFASGFYLAKKNMNLENWLTNCTWIILIFMAVSQVIGLISGNLIRGYGSDYASAGLIDQPSVTATLIVSTLPVFLQSFPYKRMSLAGIIICLVSLFFTMRRTVLIAAIAAIFLVLMYDFFPFRRRIRKSTVIIAILTLCALGIISLRTQAGADLLARMSDLNPLYGTGSGRYTFWFIALKHILNRNIISMIMGDGLGRIRDVMYNDFGMYIGSHNDLLDFTYAFGIFGLFTLIWWYYELIRFTNYLRINKATAFQGSLSVITIFIIISMGQGGESYNPDLALIFMILGIWAGQKSYV